ncbi:MAG: M23 family metallopeptidase [Gemmatimonadota bacterium]
MLAALLVTAACGGAARATTSPDPAPVTRDSGASPDAMRRLAGRGLMVPVSGVNPASLKGSFKAPRSGERTHWAIDIPAPRGTAVVSADSGTVWKVRSNSLGGLTVHVLDLDSEFVHYYAHLDSYHPSLSEGKLVGWGDVLGYVGTTGNAPRDLPHLHYQLLLYRGNGRWWDGEPVDPLPFLTRPGRVMPR